MSQYIAETFAGLLHRELVYVVVHRAGNRIWIRRGGPARSISNLSDIADLAERLAQDSACRVRTTAQRWTNHRALPTGVESSPGLASAFPLLRRGIIYFAPCPRAYRSSKNFDLRLPSVETGARQGLLQATLINALNPNPYLFWTFATGPILIKGWRETPLHGISFVLGFYATMILILCTIILIFGSARQLGPKVNRALLGISAVALLCFGLHQLWLGSTTQLVLYFYLERYNAYGPNNI